MRELLLGFFVFTAIMHATLHHYILKRDMLQKYAWCHAVENYMSLNELISIDNDRTDVTDWVNDN